MRRPIDPILVRGPQSFVPNDDHLLRRQRRFAEWSAAEVHLCLLLRRQFGGKTEEHQAFPLIQMVRDVGKRWKFFQFVPIGEHLLRGQFAAFDQGQIADGCHVVDGQSDNHMHQEGPAPHHPAEPVAGDEIPPGLANLAGADFEQGARSSGTAHLVQRLQAGKRKLVQLFADRSDEREVTPRTTCCFDRHLERLFMPGQPPALERGTPRLTRARSTRARCRTDHLLRRSEASLKRPAAGGGGLIPSLLKNSACPPRSGTKSRSLSREARPRCCRW